MLRLYHPMQGNLDSRIQKILACGSKILEFGLPLMIGIWNQSPTDKESRIRYLECGIHGVESTIKDCLALQGSYTDGVVCMVPAVLITDTIVNKNNNIGIAESIYFNTGAAT